MPRDRRGFAWQRTGGLKIPLSIKEAQPTFLNQLYGNFSLQLQFLKVNFTLVWPGPVSYVAAISAPLVGHFRVCARMAPSVWGSDHIGRRFAVPSSHWGRRPLFGAAVAAAPEAEEQVVVALVLALDAVQHADAAAPVTARAADERQETE